MSRGVNRVTLLGNVGNDPEIRTTQSGMRVAKCSLATNRTWEDRQGRKQEDTEWHRLTFLGKLADIVEQWVHKGDRLYIEGRVHYSTSEGRDGSKQYWTEIVVQELNMLGSPNGQQYDDRDHREPPREQRRAPAPAPAPAQAPTGQSYDGPDDDLPF